MVTCIAMQHDFNTSADAFQTHHHDKHSRYDLLVFQIWVLVRGISFHSRDFPCSGLILIISIRV